MNTSELASDDIAPLCAEIKFPLPQSAEPADLPDTDRLGEKMTVQFITLRPLAIASCGTAVRLVPYAQEKRLPVEFCDEESLPLFDLRAAGIPTDRTTQTIMRRVQERLARQRYRWSAPYRLFPFMSAGSMFDELRTATFFSLVFNTEEEVTEADIVRSVRRSVVEGSLSLTGREIKGLSLSKPITGSFGALAHFLLRTDLPKDSPILRAFHLAVSYGHLRERRNAMCDRLITMRRALLCVPGARSRLEKKIRNIDAELLAMSQRYSWLMAQAA